MRRDAVAVIPGCNAFAAWFPVKPGTKEAAVPWGAYQTRRPSPEEQAKWQRRFPNSNRAITTGRVTGVIVVDVDPRNGGDRSLDGKAIPVTFTVHTPSGGTHYYFKYRANVPTCVPLLPGVEVRSDDVIVLVPPSVVGGKTYDVIVEEPPADLPDWIVEAAQPTRTAGRREPIDAAAVLQGVPEGRRDVTLFRFACKLRGADLPRDVAEQLVLEAASRCTPPFPQEAAREKVVRAYRQYEPGTARIHVDVGRQPKPPDPIAPEAFHGVAGEIVHVIDPWTEADPAGILVQLLVVAGSIVGSGPHTIADGSRHGVNEYLALVGYTGSGSRKGTSLSHVRTIGTAVDPAWAHACVKPGLSTGEGLIHAVRDPSEPREEPVKERRRVVDSRMVVDDLGVSDKRLLVVETEFGRTLRVMGRDGNTLSAVLRDAFDGVPLRVLTRVNPVAATGAHVSLLGHITPEELRRELTDTQAANGFGNRFLWLWVTRSKELPDGAPPLDASLAPLVHRLRGIAEAAQRMGELSRDEKAQGVWREVYSSLTRRQPGLSGALIGRAEVHVLRVSMLYALLDQSPRVRAEHLEAALAVWDYAEASARFLFGASLGDPTADEILRALGNTSDGLTQSAIHDLFKRSRKVEEINRALGVLLEHGLVIREQIETGGRPATCWRATTAQQKAPEMSP